jgi:putative ABC transport system permease protein
MVTMVALFVGMYLVYNTMATSVTQRRKEIAIFSALGVGKRGILLGFLLEGLFIGVAGSIVGIVVGIVLAKAALSSVTTTISRVYLVAGAGGLPITPEHIFKSLAFGVVLSLAAVYFPAREAAQTAPAETLRGSRFQAQASRQSPFLFVVGTLFVALAWPVAGIETNSTVPFGGYAGAVLIILGSSMMIPAVTLLCSRLLHRVSSSFSWIEVTLGGQRLTRSLVRTGLAIASLVTAMALVICISAMVKSFNESIKTWIKSSITAELLVTFGTPYAGPSNIPKPFELKSSIEEQEGVRYVNTFRMIEVFARGRQVSLCSINIDQWVSENPLDITEGTIEATVGPYDGIVSENLQAKLDLHAGDTLVVDSPSGSIDIRVAAIFTDYTSDRGAIFVQRDTYQKHWNDNLIDTFDVYLNPGYSPESVASSLRTLLRGEGKTHILSQKDLKQQILLDVDETFHVVYALEAIAFIIAVIGIGNTLTASAIDRAHENAILRSMGAKMGQLRKIIYSEAITMAVIGSILGLLSGAFLSVLLIDVIQYRFTGWRLSYAFPVTVACILTAVALVASVGASVVPAMSLRKRELTRALPHE